MSNIISFDEKLSTYGFYNNILVQFYYIYKQKQGVPVLDLTKTVYVSTNVVPVLLAFGDYLKRLYHQPIRLMCNQGSELQNFFICSYFYQISNKLGIFDWGEDILSGWNLNELRSEHKISYTETFYSDAAEITDLYQRRDYIFDCLYDKHRTQYQRILSDTNQLPNNIITATINAIAEIETNAIMYSKSHSFTFVASDRFGTNICIADSGIGFEKSFELVNRPLEINNLLMKDDDKFKNFYTIMSALNFSYQKNIEQKREDLWTLKNNVISNNGLFKIQYANTQVVFSSTRCCGCKKFTNNDKNIMKCVKCLLDDYSDEIYSPIHLYKIGFQGVRVEITINKEG